ncbi:MAG TPA: cellulose-binding protein, partial [Rugosimonospora sp.]|nr:cellulose-binding protein [Rugosimonospora sp.]
MPRSTQFRRSPRRRARTVLLAALAAALLAVVPAVVANALTTSGTPTPVTGNATWFDALGAPYGGCGLPQANLDSQNFLALNVYNTPGDYSFYPRPLTGANLAKMGMWDNGHNCGRYVQVTISDYCTGINDGAPGQPFCRNGSFVPDSYNGATLTMLVADSCGDSNAWCRDDPYHVDLAHAALDRFTLNGSVVSGLADHWNNRHVTWSFVPAPNYTGDIAIGFLQGAQVWWPAIAVSHLANGVHAVEYLQNGAWVS